MDVSCACRDLGSEDTPLYGGRLSGEGLRVAHHTRTVTPAALFFGLPTLVLYVIGRDFRYVLSGE